jgi:dipeptidase D
METIGKVLDFFSTISAIPRKSGDEKAISDYLVNFADKHHLDYLRDGMFNVLVRKPGTTGLEGSPALILQTHMDMVYETLDQPYGRPIKVRQDGHLLRAEGTSLGADNGIGMSYALAILESDEIPHPPLEVLFTVQEENGLIGASNLGDDWLSGKVLINLDNEEEKVIPVGCAGAFRAELSMKGEREQFKDGIETVLLSVSGLEGGHSGLKIGECGGNAIVILAQVLYELFWAFNLRLVNINGGSRMNNIPAAARAQFCVEAQQLPNLLEKTIALEKRYSAEFARTDSAFSMTVAIGNSCEIPYNRESTRRLLQIILLLPNGPLSMSKDFPEIVQTSSNIGIIENCNDGGVKIVLNPRSSVDMHKQLLKFKLESLADLASATLKIDSEYPSWEYASSSPLRELYGNEYSLRYGDSLQYQLLHGGLECGVLKEKYKLTDVISIGPDIFDVHTPKEAVDLDSVERVWNCLKGVLQKWR